MARLNHAYSLLIGTPANTSSKQTTNSSFKSTVDLDNNLQSSNSKSKVYELTTYQISFKITKDTNKEPNKSTITIVNLNDDTVHYINNNIKNNLAIVLNVGYQGEELVQVFKGTVQWISDTKNGTDRQTELHCLDGGVNLVEAQTSRSYPKGTAVKTIINDLVKDLGTPVGNVKIDSTQTMPSATHYIGNTGTNLDHLTKSINHSFSIQDGSVSITPLYSRLNANSSYISPETGLIGSPQPFHNDIKPHKRVTKTSSTKKPKPTDGIRLKCEIDGTILPDKTIYLKSHVYDGAYKVVSVTHSGDYEGNDWSSSVEVVSVSAIINF